MIYLRKFIFLLFVISVSAFSQDLSKGSFHTIAGMQNEIEYNGRPAVVIGAARLGANGDSRIPMLIWTQDHSPEFVNALVKPQNLLALDEKAEIEKSADEVLANFRDGLGLSAFIKIELSDNQKRELENIQSILIGLGSPVSLLQSGDIKRKARLIGAYIAALYGMEGMRFVAEANWHYTKYIERAWDGIGYWRS